MQVVAFMNMKGGVAKTTLAVNVAYGLAFLHKKQVLVVDADPQFNATQCLIGDEKYLKHVTNPAKGTLKDIFIPKTLPPLSLTNGQGKASNKGKLGIADCTLNVFTEGKGRLDIVPSTLGSVEVQTSRRQTENKLKVFLQEKASHYDYVIIDCPPTISIFTEAATLASDKYIVPIRPDPLSVLGLPLLERYIDDYTSDLGAKIEQIGLVFTLVRGPTPKLMKSVMDELRAARQASVFAQHMSQATDIAESVTAHQPILRFRGAKQKARLEIVDITAEFLKRTGG